METIALSLVSHTNVGKTTLARTLLRRDVGRVFDQAHVTDVAEAHTLAETDDARLVLWDTPGFGDTARLLKRLRAEGNPLGWFLHAVWDRVADRPLWCSQEALRNIRQDADVVLYLVSAAEAPEDAAYVDLELELLGWVGRPVLVLLNQLGDQAEDEQLLADWRAAVGRHEVVADVLGLDAFTRCWVQEVALLERVGELLPAARRPAMTGLVGAWAASQRAVFEEAVQALAGALAETAADREPVPREKGLKAGRAAAMAALADRLELRQRRLAERLLEVHQLEGRAAEQLRETMEDFAVANLAPMTVKGGALWGGLVSGAASGLTAEVLSGGLTFGGGVVLGALAGALGGAGLARGFELVAGRGEPRVSWGEDFFERLCRRDVGLYLAVSQFGRGRGAVDDDLLAEEARGGPWRQALDQALAERRRELLAARTALAEGQQGADLASPLRELLVAVLTARFPEAGRQLRTR